MASGKKSQVSTWGQVVFLEKGLNETLSSAVGAYAL